MPYPDEKETFRRVVGEDLTQGIPGDVIKAEDHNLTVDFLERLQDILGLNPQGSASSVAVRLQSLEDTVNSLSPGSLVLYHKFSPNIEELEITPASPFDTTYGPIQVKAGDLIELSFRGKFTNAVGNVRAIDVEVLLSGSCNPSPFRFCGASLYFHPYADGCFPAGSLCVAGADGDLNVRIRLYPSDDPFYLYLYSIFVKLTRNVEVI